MMDLSGGKTSEDSIATSAITLAEAYVVDFQLDSGLFSLVAVLRLRVRAQGFNHLLFLVTDWSGSETTLSASGGEVVRQITRNADVHVPLGTWFCKVEGTTPSVEDPAPGSGSDSVRGCTPGPVSLGPRTPSVLFLAFLRAHQTFCSGERKPGSGMLSVVRSAKQTGIC